MKSKFIQSVCSFQFWHDLLRGKISLALTYWLFGVFTIFIFFLITLLLEYNLFSLSGYEFINYLWNWWNGFTILYIIFISIAIWNSAGNYRGKPIWRILARAATLSFLICISVYLYENYQHPKWHLKKEVSIINSKLPFKIDNETELESTSLEEDNLFYNYKLINQTIDNININQFTKKFEPLIKENICESEETRKLLDEGININYVYRDKNDVFISKITIRNSDC